MTWKVTVSKTISSVVASNINCRQHKSWKCFIITVCEKRHISENKRQMELKCGSTETQRSCFILSDNSHWIFIRNQNGSLGSLLQWQILKCQKIAPFSVSLRAKRQKRLILCCEKCCYKQNCHQWTIVHTHLALPQKSQWSVWMWLKPNSFFHILWSDGVRLLSTQAGMTKPTFHLCDTKHCKTQRGCLLANRKKTSSSPQREFGIWRPYSLGALTHSHRISHSQINLS